MRPRSSSSDSQVVDRQPQSAVMACRDEAFGSRTEKRRRRLPSAIVSLEGAVRATAGGAACYVLSSVDADGFRLFAVSSADRADATRDVEPLRRARLDRAPRQVTL